MPRHLTDRALTLRVHCLARFERVPALCAAQAPDLLKCAAWGLLGAHRLRCAGAPSREVPWTVTRVCVRVGRGTRMIADDLVFVEFQ